MTQSMTQNEGYFSRRSRARRGNWATRPHQYGPGAAKPTSQSELPYPYLGQQAVWMDGGYIFQLYGNGDAWLVMSGNGPNITDWTNQKPTDPIDGMTVEYEVQGNVVWSMRYNGDDANWKCVGGPFWNQWRYTGISNGNSSWGTLAGETISFASVPGGRYEFGLGFYHESNTLNSYVGMTVLGDINTEALTQAEASATGSGNASTWANKTIADGTTIVPHWIRTSGSCTVYRSWMNVRPLYLD